MWRYNIVLFLLIHSFVHALNKSVNSYLIWFYLDQSFFFPLNLQQYLLYILSCSFCQIKNLRWIMTYILKIISFILLVPEKQSWLHVKVIYAPFKKICMSGFLTTFIMPDSQDRGWWLVLGICTFIKFSRWF